ncbi:MAG: FHA domain-containing protein, partial [Planctomycetes bacterium]|nr:FHA domain-containing protein [Planctomycetota bacterium]
MFDLKLQVRLKQAQNAFHDGRLDEAFAIASEKAIRDLRGGQQLLEGLVEPLLDRAGGHLAAGRLREAMLDVERAVHAGGDRPRAAQLRQEVREAIAAREKEERRAREALESARAHLDAGSFRTGLEALGDASGPLDAARLRREVESRERKGLEARARARAHLERGDLLEALRAAREAAESDPRHTDMPGLRADVKQAAAAAAEKALLEGSLETAADLLGEIEGLAAESIEARRLAGRLSLARDAADAFQRDAFEEARVLAGRLEKALPGAAWVEECLRELMKITEALPLLRAGPLGRPLALARPAPSPSPPPPGGGAPRPASLPAGDSTAVAVPRHERLHLWIDGVGTYLLLGDDRVSFGRSGSSARPAIALPADLSGYHAEVLRSEEDYFLVAAQGPVQVGGQPVKRKLLEDGDRIDLGPACRLTFKLPTALSPTAVLTLHRGLRLEGDVRSIVLFKDTLLLGPGAACHVTVPAKGGTVILSRAPGGQGGQ